MDRKDELKQIITESKETLRVATQKLNEILLAESINKSEFKIGDRVTHYKKQYEIVSSRLKYEGVQWGGRLVLKDGTLGKKVFDLYGKLTKC